MSNFNAINAKLSLSMGKSEMELLRDAVNGDRSAQLHFEQKYFDIEEERENSDWDEEKRLDDRDRARDMREACKGNFY
jgi:hypothetical protein